MKNIQGTIHTFSVAVIIRRMIDLFFKYKVKRKLNKLKRVLKYIESKVNKIKNSFKPYKKKHYEVHMYDDETNSEYIILVFSKNFTLLGFEKSP